MSHAPIQPELLPKVADRFKALADQSRLRLLLRLKAAGSAGCNVTSLSKELAINQASVSKHLSVLKQAGLVQSRRDGLQIRYAVRDRSVFDLCSVVCDGVLRHLREEHAALNLSAPSKVKGKKS